MAKKKPYQRQLQTASELVTPYEATRAGFVALALERNRRATPFVAQAQALKVAASEVKDPAQLMTLTGIQAALLAAAGVSDKAAGHLQPYDKTDAIQGLIQNFLEPAGPDFVEELVFRFLLTRGDTLGGSMRNVGGVLAQRKLARALISALRLAGQSYQWLHATENTWKPMLEDDTDVENYVRGLSWQRGSLNRTLIYNLTVPVMKNNVDLCLLDCSSQLAAPAVYKTPERYLALGELKGGIDPAGADEHWKTARTALTRIQTSFSVLGLAPKVFFVGAAIEKKMAAEIWNLLEDGHLDNAANLTDACQVAAISNWLCSL